MVVNSWRVSFLAVAVGCCVGLMAIMGSRISDATEAAVPTVLWALSAILFVLLLGSLWFICNMFSSLRVVRQFAGALGDDLAAPLPKQNVGLLAPLTNALDQMRQVVAERQQQALAQSQHCRLTGLSNRLWVELKLPELLQQPGIQLVLVNIKDFKHVNDSFGYHNGDSLLQQLAQRLADTPELELVARLGSDEFLLVVPAGYADQDFKQWRAGWTQNFKLGDSMLKLQLAMAVYAATPPVEVDDALRRSAIAMMHAKQEPALFARYQTGQDESYQRELMLLNQLPQALQNGEMFVVYQPKVDIRLKQVKSAEALIRWQHPTLGFVPPIDFIRLAEHAGLISAVTDWMLEHVIAQIAAWQPKMPVQIAVNLSAHDLLNPSLPDFVAALLARYQVAASLLALEVTEGAVMQDPQQVINNLYRLREMGISLSIDDFGTGQSSLAYLKRLPVHEVKIDRAFVKEIEKNSNDRLIVSTTASLAHGLGLKVTAEGLENPSGLALLQDAGVDVVQGYYFSKPLKAADFVSWLQQFNHDHTRWW